MFFPAAPRSRYLSFTEEAGEVEAMFPVGVPERLAEVKRAHDPHGLFKANHEIGPA